MTLMKIIKSISVNINNIDDIAEAYTPYYCSGDQGYSFQLVDNGNVIHSFSDSETVYYYIHRSKNWDRNKNQTLDINSLQQAEKLSSQANPILIEMKPGESIFHQQGAAKNYNPQKNRKFVTLDGKQEFVFNELGDLVTDAVNQGTYNYSTPKNWLMHGLDDVIPWIKWGTCPSDPTTRGQRILTTVTFGIYRYKGSVD